VWVDVDEAKEALLAWAGPVDRNSYDSAALYLTMRQAARRLPTTDISVTVIDRQLTMGKNISVITMVYVFHETSWDQFNEI
jgi:hypothetical protein